MFKECAINQIGKLLIKRQETVAVAESVTSGLLQTALSTGENAMKFYQGGLTAYNLGQKTRLLNIDPIKGMNCNCVSSNIAEELAMNVCKLFCCDWGIGITGYASPVPESENKQYAYFAICRKENILRSIKLEFEKGDPFSAQLFFVNCILDEFSKVVLRSN